MSTSSVFSNEPIEVVVRNLLTGRYDRSQEDFFVKTIIEQDYRFSSDEIKIMRSARNKQGTLFSFQLAQAGYLFTFAEVIQLGNPTDEFGTTIFMEMAKKKNASISPIDKILALGDKPDKMGDTLSIRMARNGHLFTFDELMRLGNSMDGFGISVARYMARNGFLFTVNQILTLGDNPDLSRCAKVLITFS